MDRTLVTRADVVLLSKLSLLDDMTYEKAAEHPVAIEILVHPRNSRGLRQILGATWMLDKHDGIVLVWMGVTKQYADIDRAIATFDEIEMRSLLIINGVDYGQTLVVPYRDLVMA